MNITAHDMAGVAILLASLALLAFYFLYVVRISAPADTTDKDEL